MNNLALVILLAANMIMMIVIIYNHRYDDTVINDVVKNSSLPTYTVNTITYQTKPYTCPVCNGAGHVMRPPNVPGDVQTWDRSSSTGPFECRACSGKGIVWKEEDEST